MQGKQAYPACYMNRVLMGMLAFLRDVIGNIVDNNNSIKQYEKYQY
ncbi:conserved hypothetical protein [Klebsiella quasipneumoniae subsp. similipneumoniae]|nr:conserved hypothetical protein [Klebsiella quasipneumoniae subsp. similipneumoniae]